MPTSFQHQSPERRLNLFKSVPKPQHGKKAAPEAAVKAAEARSFEPMPGRS
jgi:hypothetical protein